MGVCIVCLVPFDRHSVLMCPPCGHIFHDVCIQQCLLRNQSCPFCRVSIAAGSMSRVYLEFESERTTASAILKLEKKNEKLRCDLQVERQEVSDQKVELAVLMRQLDHLQEEVAKREQMLTQFNIQIEKYRLRWLSRRKEVKRLEAYMVGRIKNARTYHRRRESSGDDEASSGGADPSRTSTSRGEERQGPVIINGSSTGAYATRTEQRGRTGQEAVATNNAIAVNDIAHEDDDPDAEVVMLFDASLACARVRPRASGSALMDD